MIVLGLMSVLCFYILFERNYVIRKAGKEDPQFMDKIKDYILGGELKAAIAYCRSVDTPSARMIEKGISRLGRSGRKKGTSRSSENPSMMLLFCFMVRTVRRQPAPFSSPDIPAL